MKRPRHQWFLSSRERRRAALLGRLSPNRWVQAATIPGHHRAMFYADLYALVDAGVVMMRQARPRGPIWIRRHRTIEEQQRDEDAWRAKGEAAIRREMDRRLEVYHQHKRRKDRLCESSRAS